MHPDPAETNRRAYDDARVVALYDLDNPPGEDHAYFRRAAEESGVRRIVDLGCGTGSLTVTLTGYDRAVVGIDPAEAMLSVARARPGGDRVEWRRGTAELIEPASADLVIMSGNVAMHLIGQDWHDALRGIAAGLVPGGRLLFETRNPVRRAWEDWQQEPRERTTAAGRLVESETTSTPDEGVVREGEEHLQFRSVEQVAQDLAAAGLAVDRVWSDWHGRPFDAAEHPLMIIEACPQGA